MALTESSDLIVEDGTGLYNANSYIAIATATAYHLVRDNTDWADATEHDRVASLVRATQYIDERFTYEGVIFNDVNTLVLPLVDGPQSLIFPRAVLEDRNGVDVAETVPVEIEQACAEYALRVLNSGGDKIQLQPDPAEDEKFRTISLFREKVGPIEEETRYDTGASLRTVQPYPAADRILFRSGYIVRSTGTVR